MAKSPPAQPPDKFDRNLRQRLEAAHRIHIPRLIAFHRLGENRNSPRLWLESRRLEVLSFVAGTPFVVERRSGAVRLRVSPEARITWHRNVQQVA